jgi:myosin-1
LNQSKTTKPVPGGGKPRPPAKPKPVLPKYKALYDYAAKDVDELSFQEGDIIEVLSERTYFNVLFWSHVLGSYCIHK